MEVKLLTFDIPKHVYISVSNNIVVDELANVLHNNVCTV